MHHSNNTTGIQILIIAQKLKALDFLLKEICPYYCRFVHTQKESGGASIHMINE